ncbi:hypothetical protein [Pseudomonas sp. 37 R 15]|nr:hypothetical protein [Pseudomonas sp. 37 R 15]
MQGFQPLARSRSKKGTDLFENGSVPFPFWKMGTDLFTCQSSAHLLYATAPHEGVGSLQPKCGPSHRLEIQEPCETTFWQFPIVEHRAYKNHPQKSPRSFDLGLFRSYMVPRRRLNWVLRCPYSLGVVGGASVRHTCGHTRRFLLATFSWHPRGAKQHQIVTSSFDLLPPVRRGQG